MPSDKAPHEECPDMRMPHSMPRGFLRLVLLGLLKGRELSGMDIMRILAERTDGIWQPSPGSIYPLLASLEDNGAIEVARTEGRSKIYRLSKQGLGQLRAAFKKKGALSEKANMGPRLWEKLLDPVERARFNVMVFTHHLSSLESILDRLTTRQKQKLLSHLEQMSDHLTTIIEHLKKENQ